MTKLEQLRKIKQKMRETEKEIVRLENMLPSNEGYYTTKSITLKHMLNSFINWEHYEEASKFINHNFR